MSAPRATLRLALMALPAFAVLPSRAAGTEAQDAPRTLRDAKFEAAPPTLEGGRFRLGARLHPAPAPAATDDVSRLKLSAAIAPKASTETCPMPGAIFSDGYESP